MIILCKKGDIHKVGNHQRCSLDYGVLNINKPNKVRVLFNGVAIY